MTSDQTVTASSLRAVHIVDATQGPLVGDGRLRRVLPFAVTTTVSMLIAVPATSWADPSLAVAGSVIIAAAIVASLVFPWHRTARAAQLSSPLFILAGTLLLAAATGNGIRSPFLTLSVVPLMWLAIYENRIAVLSAATLTGVALWLAAQSSDVELQGNGTVSTAVFIICGAGMGITLHGLVADARRLTRALRDQTLALEQAAAMLDALPERVNRYRLSDHVITYCNTAWATQYDADPGEAIGRQLEQFLSADERDGLHSQLALLGPDNPILADSVARAVDNAPGQWVEWVDRYLTGPDGAQILSVGRDVTKRRDAETRLAESEMRFRDLADNSADVVWRFLREPSPHFDYMSPSVETILGYPPSYFLDDFSRMLDIIGDDDRTAINSALHGTQVLAHFDFHFRHANGSIVVGETRTTEIRGGLQGVSRDVTELRQLQDSMAQLALHDPLTGLANRRLLIELLDAELARTERNGLPLAVAYLDLDGFKNVNDAHGHDAGDVVLCETARRLLTIVRGADTVARLGGDEFVIVFQPNDANSHDLTTRLDRGLSEPIKISATTIVTCPASIGIADTRTVGYNGAALLAAADDAMYLVKRTQQVQQEEQQTRRPSTVV
jgi:diguanylate cyclase (GGDEF)-like protein/PAS domain S-box-containing protein